MRVAEVAVKVAIVAFATELTDMPAPAVQVSSWAPAVPGVEFSDSPVDFSI